MTEDIQRTNPIAEASCRGDAVHIDLWYPRSERVRAIVVGLMDVRAADDIRIEYDFDRDGWVIKQATVSEWEVDDPECDPKWKEVAFVQAWGSDTTRNDD